MASLLECLQDLNSEVFQTVVSASSKSFREQVFRRLNIRQKPAPFSFKTSAQTDEKIGKFHDVLKGGKDPGPEILSEIFRNYFYTQRPLLADALDFLKVKHDDGLTNENLDFLKDYTEQQFGELSAHLNQKHEAAPVALYVSYLQNSEDADE